MLRFGSALALVSVAAIVAACGSSSGFSSVLPQSVQREIARKFPRIAYVPARAPYRQGSHYTGFFSPVRHTFELSFSTPGGSNELVFTVARVRRCAEGPSMHTFRLNRLRIMWDSPNGSYQTAWRCVRRGHVAVSIGADDSLGVAIDRPFGRAQAMRLVRMVAYAKFISSAAR